MVQANSIAVHYNFVEVALPEVLHCCRSWISVHAYYKCESFAIGLKDKQKIELMKF